MLFSLLTGSAQLFDGSSMLALAAATLLAVATIWMAHRGIARSADARGNDNAAQRFGWRSARTPVLVRAKRPDVPGRPRPRAPGADDRGAR